MIFQNYHRHSMFTNIRVSDCVTSNDDYAKRAKELGHGIISTCEHGYQGRYIEGYELAKKYDLKFVFSVEAYWVKDRFEKDRTNCHIFLAARNENGRQAINDVLSEANITGYYGQARLDIDLLLSLPKDDIIVTTACVAFWKYDDAEEVVKKLYDHFGKNFYLEVQYHNTEKQAQINNMVLDLSEKYGIEIIMGCDSHYISEDNAWKRTEYLSSKGMRYEDEDGWFMDYPDGDEAYKRFASQCVLSHDQIVSAMQNTNVFLEVEEYNNPCFTQDIKMPTLYPTLSQEEKNRIYFDLVYEKWEEHKKKVPEEMWEIYEREIAKEVQIVLETNHSDYFLLDYEIIKRGIESGGIITSSGRGSAVSFFTNKLLGFTEVDRIASKVKMYPERFMSPTRILETKSLADIDFNLGTVEIFADAQREILGEKHAYPMMAYGTMKPKAAWKMYSKSQDISFEITNEVSKQIERYEMALKYADENDREFVDVRDYIESSYRDIYEQSSEYLGVISDAKIHPCSYLLYQGDIRKEIGLIKIKDHLCCIMDGKWAEEYKFLKNDLLKVSVVEMIEKVYRRIGIKRHTANELLEICENDNQVWDIYKKGCTLGINQVEQPASRGRVAKYKPKNIVELCAFVAALRPAFRSMYKIFEKREHFDYGIKSFDELIQTPEMTSTFILYQEMSMATLHYAGIPMSECYDIIKNIAKKRVDKVLKYKNAFINGFSKVLIENEGQTEQQAKDLSDKVWQILEDSSQYSFNASHSYCMAIDSLYGAYLKAKYPYEFYETFLRILQEKGEKDRMNAVKAEAENYFKIRFSPFKFRQDNRKIMTDKENGRMINSLSSIKGFGRSVSNVLYDLSNVEFDGFFEFLLKAKEVSLSRTAIEKLVKIDYFSEFGNTTELLMMLEMFEMLKEGDAKQVAKEKVVAKFEDIFRDYCEGNRKDGSPAKSYFITDMQTLMKKIEERIFALRLPEEPMKEKIKSHIEILGYIDVATNKEEDKRKLVVMSVRQLMGKYSDEPWAYIVTTRSLGTGKNSELTILSKLYKVFPVLEGDIVYAKTVQKHKSGYWHLTDYKQIA